MVLRFTIRIKTKRSIGRKTLKHETTQKTVRIRPWKSHLKFARTNFKEPLALVEECNRTPCDLQIHTKRGKLQLEVRNQSARPITLPKGIIICKIGLDELVENTTDERSEHHPDIKIPNIPLNWLNNI